MRRLLFIYLFLGMNLMAIGQKSRVLAVFQMIEAEKYEEAKEDIELAIWNDRTARWPRTYYAKGLLCQKAFEAGFEKNDAKKMNIYPDQLVVAYDAYEKAVQLDSRNRITSIIASHYYSLANDFQKLGERYYQRKEYNKAMVAFEHALLISKNPLLSVQTDTGLVYNTAIAAYEAEEWGKAISYLTGLNDDAYSPTTAVLLYHAYMYNGDTVMAEEVLFESEERYKSEETIVLQLVDLLVETDRKDQALKILETAVSRRPDNYNFSWTRGLIYQSMGLYDQAITSLLHANELAPDEDKIYYNLGICYYNIGVEINEAARKMKNNLEYQAARKEAKEKFQEAVKWLEEAHDLNPDDQETISKLYQLYYRLQMTEKQKAMKLLIQ